MLYIFLLRIIVHYSFAAGNEFNGVNASFKLFPWEDAPRNVPDKKQWVPDSGE